MKKFNITKILIIISIIIFGLGVLSGISIINDLSLFSPIEKLYIDGSDFSGLAQIGGSMLSFVIGISIIFYSIFIDILIWIIYGITLIIIKIVKKIYNRK